jgi:hypothetical protein
MPYRSPTAAGDSYAVWYTNGVLHAGVTSPAGTQALSWPYSPVTGVWVHLAYTYSITAMRQLLYVDGIPRAGDLASAAPGYDGHPLYLGANDDATGDAGPAAFSSGDIAEVHVWRYARSQPEIQWSMRSRLGPMPDLIGCWRLDDGILDPGSAVAHDSSGFAREGLRSTDDPIVGLPMWLTSGGPL